MTVLQEDVGTEWPKRQGATGTSTCISPLSDTVNPPARRRKELRSPHRIKALQRSASGGTDGRGRQEVTAKVRVERLSTRANIFDYPQKRQYTAKQWLWNGLTDRTGIAAGPLCDSMSVG